MNPQDEKFIKYWKKRSEAGRVSYLLTTTLFAIAIGVLAKFAFLLFPDHEPLTLQSIVTRILAMSVGGFFFALWQWNSNEKRYQELIKNSR